MPCPWRCTAQWGWSGCHFPGSCSLLPPQVSSVGLQSMSGNCCLDCRISRSGKNCSHHRHRKWRAALKQNSLRWGSCMLQINPEYSKRTISPTSCREACSCTMWLNGISSGMTTRPKLRGRTYSVSNMSGFCRYINYSQTQSSVDISIQIYIPFWGQHQHQRAHAGRSTLFHWGTCVLGQCILWCCTLAQ